MLTLLGQVVATGMLIGFVWTVYIQPMEPVGRTKMGVVVATCSAFVLAYIYQAAHCTDKVHLPLHVSSLVILPLCPPIYLSICLAIYLYLFQFLRFYILLLTSGRWSATRGIHGRHPYSSLRLSSCATHQSGCAHTTAGSLHRAARSPSLCNSPSQSF